MAILKTKKLAICIGLLLFSSFIIAVEPIPAETPRDGSFFIKLRTHTDACVFMNYSKGIIYAGIDYKSSGACQEGFDFWRYDALNRLSMKVDFEGHPGETMLCLTEQIEFNGRTWDFPAPNRWDYVIFKPCVTNDPRQQWRYVLGSQQSHDRLVNVASGHQVGEFEWTLATAKDPKTLYQYEIVRGLPWLTIKAAPDSYAYTLNLKWDLDDKLYSIFGDSYGALRYNPETTQISRTDKGVLYCLTSHLVGAPETIHKAYTSWDVCDDKYPASPIPLTQKWNVIGINTSTIKKNTGVPSLNLILISDKANGILRIKQAGEDWGKPYTYRLKYLAEDVAKIGYYVTSLFYDDGSHGDWRALTIGNAIQNLKSCPALGVRDSSQHSEFGPLLPTSFKLTKAWQTRLWSIVSATIDDGSYSYGACGTCSMESNEIILNFDNYQNDAPAAGVSGLLFDYQTEVGPVGEFIYHHPLITEDVNRANNMIFDLAKISNAFWDVGDYKKYNPVLNKIFANFEATNIMQPLYQGARLKSTLVESMRAPEGTPIPKPFTGPPLVKSNVVPSLQRLFTQPSGTVWRIDIFYQYYLPEIKHFDGLGHAFIMLKDNSGIHVIDVAIGPKKEKKTKYLKSIEKVYTNADELWEGYFVGGVWEGFDIRYIEIDAYQIERVNNDSAMSYFEVLLSRENCLNPKKDGARGFGTGKYDDVPPYINLCGDDGERCANHRYSNSCPK